MHVTKVEFLEDIKEKSIQKITLTVNLDQLTENLVEELVAVIQNNNGKVPLYFNILDKEDGQNVIMQSTSHQVAPNYQMFDFFDENPALSYIIN